MREPFSFRLVAPERRIASRLPDGRVLSAWAWGPADGRAVLFCPGAGMSGALGFGHEVLASSGRQLVAVDRPGLGGSDPDPGKTLASVAADIAALVAAEGLSRPVAVGFSQSAPFALALAAAGIVERVALVSGQDDFGDPDIAARLDPQVGGMVAAARADPAGFEAQVAATATADWLWSMIAAMSGAADRAVYEAPEFALRYRAALDEGFRQGAAGYARDLVAAVTPWPFAPEAIGVPVDLWYGALDTSPVHSPDFGATLERRLPRARRTVLPDAGSALLWTHAADILGALAD